MEKNEVLVFEEKGEFFTTSLDVAEKFQKRNVDVLRSVENLHQIALIDKCKIAHMFELFYYKDSAGREQKAYNMTRDGFSLLVMGFTGSGVMAWKLKYINAFNKLEKYVNAIQQQEFKNKTDPERILLRQENKDNNKAFNKEVDRFMVYADQSGSKSPKMYFLNFNNMVNHAMFDFPKSLKNISDKLTPTQYMFINSMKQAIAHEIQLGMSEGIYYKEIFKKCRARAEKIADGLGVTPIPMLLEQNKPILIGE